MNKFSNFLLILALVTFLAMHLPLNRSTDGTNEPETRAGTSPDINPIPKIQRLDEKDPGWNQTVPGITPTSNRVSVARLGLVTPSPHGPINIKSDAEFSSCNCTTGDGSSGNPFVIQDYFIDGTNGVGVSISNTRAYFV